MSYCHHLFTEHGSAAGERLPWHHPRVVEIHGKEAQKARFLDELKIWTDAAKETRDKTSRRRASLRADERLRAARQDLLEALARYSRLHPRSDVAPGLLHLIAAMSDNDLGACSLSVQRMGEVMSREPDSIREALQRLIDDGLVEREERAGNSTLYWVTAPAQLDTVHPLWVVEVYSPTPRARGRPAGKPLPVKGEPFAVKPLPLEGEPFSDEPLTLEPEGLTENPSPSSPKTPPPPPRDDFSLKKKEESPACAGSVDSAFEAFWQAYPRRDGKEEARKGFVKLCTGRHQSKKRATPQQLIDAARIYAISKRGTDQRYIKQASVWLNQAEWLDDKYQRAGAGPDPASEAENDLAAAFAAARAEEEAAREARWRP